MMNVEDQSLMTQLKQMVAYFHDLRHFLHEDKVYFTKNDLVKLEQSNQHKTRILEHIAHLVNEISGYAGLETSTNLFVNLEKRAGTLNDAVKNEFNTILSQLKLEISECHEEIAVNSKVIHTTIHNIKLVWDKLINYKSDMDCVYNYKGSKIK